MPQNRTFPAKALGRSSHISIASVTVAFALSQGITMDEIEAVTGLDGATLGNPDARLNDRIPHQIWVALAERSQGAVALGIEAARAAPFTALGGLVHGAQYAATLRDALEFMCRNRAHLADRLDFEILTTADETVVTGRHPNDGLDRGRVSEVGAGLLARLVREVLGVTTPPARVELAFEPLGPDEAYSAFFRCPVHFNSGRAALVFANETMEHSVTSADPTLFEFVERHFAITAHQIEPMRSNRDISRLRHAIADSAECGDYRVEAICRRARMSARTAQRIAAAHGTTLNDMIGSTRQSVSEALLADTNVQIDSIAMLLGYSDDRAFRRAFKRWTGHSPSAYRKLNLETQ